MAQIPGAPGHAGGTRARVSLSVFGLMNTGTGRALTHSSVSGGVAKAAATAALLTLSKYMYTAFHSRSTSQTGYIVAGYRVNRHLFPSVVDSYAIELIRYVVVCL